MKSNSFVDAMHHDVIAMQRCCSPKRVLVFICECVRHSVRVYFNAHSCIQTLVHHHKSQRNTMPCTMRDAMPFHKEISNVQVFLFLSLALSFRVILFRSSNVCDTNFNCKYSRHRYTKSTSHEKEYE